MRLLWGNLMDAATLQAAAPMSTTLPLENLQNWHRQQVARTTTLATQTILLDWGEIKYVDGAVLWRHNLGNAGIWRLKLYAGANGTGTELYDSGDLDAHPVTPIDQLSFGYEPWGVGMFTPWPYRWATHWTDATYSARSASITLDDPLNPSGYLELSRILIGPTWRPSSNRHNYDWGAVCGFRSSDVTERSAGGSLRIHSKSLWREARIPFGWLAPSDYVELQNVWIQSRGKDVVLSMLPGAGGAIERNGELVGMMQPELDIVFTAARKYGAAIKVSEL